MRTGMLGPCKTITAGKTTGGKDPATTICTSSFGSEISSPGRGFVSVAAKTTAGKDPAGSETANPAGKDPAGRGFGSGKLDNWKF